MATQITVDTEGTILRHNFGSRTKWRRDVTVEAGLNNAVRHPTLLFRLRSSFSAGLVGEVIRQLHGRCTALTRRHRPTRPNLLHSERRRLLTTGVSDDDDDTEQTDGHSRSTGRNERRRATRIRPSRGPRWGRELMSTWFVDRAGMDVEWSIAFLSCSAIHMCAFVVHYVTSGAIFVHCNCNRKICTAFCTWFSSTRASMQIRCPPLSVCFYLWACVCFYYLLIGHVAWNKMTDWLSLKLKRGLALHAHTFVTLWHIRKAYASVLCCLFLLYFCTVMWVLHFRNAP